MPIEYNPKDATQCWDAGEYDAVLVKVEDSVSKRKPDGSGGNPMQVWTFRAYHPDGREQLVTEYVVVPAATFKIKQLAGALGRGPDFTTGQFQAEDHINANVILVLTVEQQEGYDDKNRVAKYLPAGGTSPARTPDAGYDEVPGTQDPVRRAPSRGQTQGRLPMGSGGSARAGLPDAHRAAAGTMRYAADVPPQGAEDDSIPF